MIIATPGRLLDHLEQKTVKLDTVNILILDEADRMLDMGFQPQIKRILAVVPKNRQTMLFSATLPSEIMAIASQNMKLPIRIEVAPSGTTAENVAQEIFIVQKGEKLRLLEKVLSEYRGSTLVFTRTKHGARKVTQVVRAMGHAAAEIHSNRSLNQRLEALEGFKSGKYRVLIATDIAARGIDVKGIELVINFDLPSQAEDYVHRIGRTGRAGATGIAISFVSGRELDTLNRIERYIGQTLPRLVIAGLEPRYALRAPKGGDSRGRQSSGRPGASTGRPRTQGSWTPARGRSETRKPEFGARSERSQGGKKSSSFGEGRAPYREVKHQGGRTGDSSSRPTDRRNRWA